MYEHWSLLCRARGHVGASEVDALCTFEYARGVSVHSILDRRLPSALRLPVPFFTYHVLNVNDRTQLLFSDVRGPRGIALQRAAHVRSVDGAATRRSGHRFTVHASEAHTAPDGRSMALPLSFTWAVDGIEVRGRTNGDFVLRPRCGLRRLVRLRRRSRRPPVSGCGYVEYVDLR